MSTPRAPAPAGPATHYELFAGLRDARVRYLVTGATALVLHGVPRISPDIDLAVDPDPANVARLEQVLASWGYGEPGTPVTGASGAAIRRFRHPQAALDQIDVVLPPPGEFPRLAGGAVAVTLVDVEIPLVGAADLRERAVRAATATGKADAEALDTLSAIRAGAADASDDPGREQVRKFSRWSVAARLDWLLAAARLDKGLSPEAKAMTRGLVRRRGWYGR